MNTDPCSSVFIGGFVHAFVSNPVRRSPREDRWGRFSEANERKTVVTLRRRLDRPPTFSYASS